MRINNANNHEAIYRALFYISVIFKGLNALIEIISGIIILLISKEQIATWLLAVIQKDSIINPQGSIGSYLIELTSHLPLSTQHFISWYLLSHGALKIIPIYGLLKRQLWAFPTAVVILVVFIVYQLIRYYDTQSVWLIVFSVIDLFVVYIIIHEYRYVRRQMHVGNTQKI